MKHYTLQACENLISKYADLGGDVVTVQEGSLGLGTVICMASGKKTAIIQERFLNEWSSSHTIRFYNKIPSKYEKLVEKVIYGE